MAQESFSDRPPCSHAAAAMNRFLSFVQHRSVALGLLPGLALALSSPCTGAAESPVSYPVEPGAIPPLVPPLATIAAVALLVLAGLLLKQSSRAILLLALVLVAAGSWWCFVARQDAETPTYQQIHETFSLLHEGIYGAFELKTEGELYDHLRRYITSGEMLDRVYNELLEVSSGSTPGGLQVSILGVAIRELAFVDRSASDFVVDCEWVVHGRVTHWNHTHERLNRYKARYTAVRRGDKWLLSDMEPLQQDQVATDADSPYQFGVAVVRDEVSVPTEWINE